MPATTEPLSPSELLSALKWRYAVKKFDPSAKIPAEKWKTLEEALVLSPSSYGLQAWKVFVVDDPELRKKLRSAAWEQPQITDADKLLVFCVKKNFGEADVDRFIDRISEVRKAPKEALAGYRKIMVASATQPPEKVLAWLMRQVYIALGVFLTSAAALGVDACPMEGFDNGEFDKLLGLTDYSAVVLATAGKRSDHDDYAKLAKVRFPIAELVQHV